MRLFSDVEQRIDGKFKRCYCRVPTLESTHRGSIFRTVQKTEVQSVDVVGIADHFSRLYCTPRCYSTRSWEVGLCQLYTLTLLSGSDKISSAEMHIVQILEQLQLVFHAAEIRDQSGAIFYLPQALCQSKIYRLRKWYKKMMLRFDIEPYLNFCMLAMECLYNEATPERLSGLIAWIKISRYRYFHETNTSNRRGVGTEYRAATKIIGFVYGLVLGRLKKLKLVLRQYCRLGRTSERVRQATI